MSSAFAFDPDQTDDTILRVYLLPGTMHCTPERAIVTTVLGSCVAVCLHDRRTGVSGMNHFLLPYSEHEGTSLRYGDYAIECLVASMLELCGSGAKLEAKVFGGSEMFPSKLQGGTVGMRNITVALDRLARHGIPVVARSTGGRSGMRIQLSTIDGIVLARRINASV